MEMKVCTRCKVEKPNTNEYYSKNKRCSGGLNTICKDCIKRYNSKYYESNREVIIEIVTEYVAKNKVKVRKYQSRYYQENKKSLSNANKQWAKENEELMREYRKKWKKNNPNVDKEYYEANKQTLLQRNAEYRKEHIEEMRHYKRKWKVANRESLHIKQRHRETNIRNGELSIIEWQNALEFFNHQCAYCGTSNNNLTQDHFIPLSKGGPYNRENIIPACSFCNSSKGNKDFKEWYRNKPYYEDSREYKILSYINQNKNKEENE